MGIHEYLMQVRILNRRINNKLQELEELQNMAEGVSAICYDKGKVQTSPNPDSMLNSVYKLIEAKKETNRLIDEYVDKKQEIIKVIETLEIPEEYDVIHMYYVQEMSCYKISVVMNYSYRTILRIKRKALAKLSHNVTLS